MKTFLDTTMSWNSWFVKW